MASFNTATMSQNIKKRRDGSIAWVEVTVFCDTGSDTGVITNIAKYEGQNIDVTSEWIIDGEYAKKVYTKDTTEDLIITTNPVVNSTSFQCSVSVSGITSQEEKVVGFCGSKCEHEVFVKGDFAVIEGLITNNEVSGHFGRSVVFLPDGFTYKNTIIISAMIDKANAGAVKMLIPQFSFSPSQSEQTIALDYQFTIKNFLSGEDRLVVSKNVYGSESSTATTDKYTVVLMKIN